MLEKFRQYIAKIDRILEAILRPVLVIVAAVAIFYFSQIPLREFDLEETVRPTSAWNAFVAFFAYQSIVRTFLLYSAPVRDKALATGKISTNFFKNIGYWLVTPTFWTNAILPLAFFWATPELPMFVHIQKSLFYGAAPDSLAYTLYAPAIATALLVIAALIGADSARRQWAYNDKKSKYDQMMGIKKKKTSDDIGFAKDFATVMIVYTAVGIVSPFIFMSVTVIGLLLSVGSILATVLLILLLIFGTRYYRAYKKRRDFIRDLTRICDEKGIPLSPIKYPYRSLFRDKAGENFSITYKGERYDCKLIAAMRHYDPMIFLANNSVVQRKNISFGMRAGPRFSSERTKVVLFSWDVQTDFHFSGEGKKVVIALPVPHTMYALNPAGATYPLDTGDRVGDYRVYNASGFLGALERDFLGRH